MINIQQHSLNQTLGSLYVSSSFTLPISIPTSVSITGGILNVNNVDVVSPYVVNPGDSLIVKITNSSSIATTSYASVTFDTTEYIFASTTVTDPVHYHLTDSLDVNPFDYTTFPNGFTVPLYSGNNKFSKLSTTNTLTEIPTSSYTLGTDSYPIDTSIPLTFIADYTQDFLYVINPQGTIVGRVSFPTGSNPSYLVDYPIQQLIAISLSGTNKVAIIDRAVGSIVKTIDVGIRPMGIVVDISDNIWVANYGSNTVSIISSDLTTVSTIAVGNGPLDITTDSAGNIWVVNSLDGTVSKLDLLTQTVVATVSVGTNPWGVARVGDFIYVSNSYSDTISKIDILSNTVIGTITLTNDTVPYSMVSTTTGTLYVACFDSATILKVVNDVIVDTIPVEKYPFGLSLDVQNNLWMANFYSNLPSRTYLKDQTPDGFSFLNIRTAHRSTVYTTNTITIAGIDEVTPASIPPIAGTHLIKNTVNVGYSTTVTNGDILSISVTTSNAYNDSLTTELTVGDWVAPYTITTELYNPYVDDYRFISITNATTNTLYTSNEVTIGGLSSDVNAPVTLVSGNLLKNNISVGLSTTVVNGDKLKIELTSSANPSTPVQTLISIGDITDIFSVTTTGTSGFKSTPNYNLGTLTNQPVNTLVSSETITITNLLDDGAEPIPNPIPITITVDPYTGAEIWVNGVASGQSVVVTNGDTVFLKGYSPLYDGHTRIINLYMGPHVFPWTIRTLVDLIPYPFIFQDLYEAVPGSTITTNISVVEGMTPGYPITVYVPYGTLLVNGIPSNSIQNGDEVQLELIAKPPYHGIRYYEISAGGIDLNTGIISSWKVGTISLRYPVHFESTNLQPIPLIPTFTKTVLHGQVNATSTLYELSHNSHTISADTKPGTVNFNSKQVTHPIATTFELSHDSVTNAFVSSFELSHGGITKAFVSSFERSSLGITKELSTSFVKLATPVEYGVPPTFEHLVGHVSNLFNVPYYYSRTHADVTYSINPSFEQIPSKVGYEVAPTFSKLSTVSHSVGPTFSKLSTVSHSVGPTFSKLHTISHSILGIPELSHTSGHIVGFLPELSRRNSYSVTLLPEISHKQTNLIPIMFVKSTVVPHYITSVGPVIGSSWTYQDIDAPHYGTFLTANDARLAGFAAGYTSVNTIRLADGSYIWVVSSADCILSTPPPPLPRTFAFGYKQGG